jgi:hypothetical protein
MNQKSSTPVFPRSFYAAYTEAKNAGIQDPVKIVPIAPLRKQRSAMY